ncbi:glycosyltransferase family 2 protein [Belliella sp. DSM 111904]|uniref:Glycosyltransferase family 2 protein n=1 Tax=Belliella filtrata TaxID=2923435 RepID=A0ABS9UYC9_9BACT|nr:glycosyltransferase family 2 protein [Belliella filtrata]MCH7409078.1 glycosyltransferase family 2 protein [Belliella filtrata]
MSYRTKVSLLITTYNWPEALELCFQSILNQYTPPDEVVFADDGSKDPTRILIESFREKTDTPIQHIWQEDDGFQLAKIRNKAIAACKHPYIIQIDGDLILNPYFIKDHINHIKPNSFTTGSRVNLHEPYSKKILNSGILPPISEIKRNSNNFFNGLRIPYLTKFLSNKYKTKNKYRDFTRGCNMAYWRDDAIQINGYNENMIGWGSEDKEFVTRMINNGKEKRFLKFSAIVYHIWHQFSNRSSQNINDEIYQKSVNQTIIKTQNGINKYL